MDFCKCGWAFLQADVVCAICRSPRISWGPIKKVDAVVTDDNTFENWLGTMGFPDYKCDCRKPAPEKKYADQWPHVQCKGCRGWIGPARQMAIDTTDKPRKPGWPFSGFSIDWLLVGGA